MSDIHFDLCGPFEGNHEYKYSMQILDAWSRRLWIYALSNKEAATVFEVFEGWVELMKAGGHGDIKRLHCDHGGEFDNRLFETWARKNGVAWNWSAPHTSEQNGVIERWNRTLQDYARTMLRAARLSDAFWPYAFRAACDVLNRLPTAGNGNRIPLAIWSDEPVEYDYLHVFGCLAFAIQPPKNRKNKLALRAIRGTYLGSAPEHKAYLIYTPSERPFLRNTRHVIFDDSRTYDLLLPRRGKALSNVPVELDAAPLFETILDWNEQEIDWDEQAGKIIAREQERGTNDGDWPSGDSLFGQDSAGQDLFVDEWTGDIHRQRGPKYMAPSTYGLRNALTTPTEIGSLMDLNELDEAWLDTPTRQAPTAAAPSRAATPAVSTPQRHASPMHTAAITPTLSPAAQGPRRVNTLAPAIELRRSERIKHQFQALTAAVQLTLQASVGEEILQHAKCFAAQVFSAAVRASADGVLIEPKSLLEAKQRPDRSKWEQGMEAELTSLKSMGTWLLTDLTSGRKDIGWRWTYKLKLDADGKAIRWKARLVAQGFSQRAGVDYNETFAPVARLTTVRILVALAIRFGLIIWSMDVVTAYLNGSITEDIYMRQPPHFDDGTGRICKLRRSLYGLKQSGREWFVVVANWLIEQLFTALKCEPCVFVKFMPNGELIVVVLYVDNVLIAAARQSSIDSIRRAFEERFKMTDNGKLSQVLGLKIVLNHDVGLATVSQQAYIEGLIRRFRLAEASAVETPMTTALQSLSPRTVGQATAAEVGEYASIIGCLMWAAQGTRPDIAYAVGRLSRFMANPRPEHLVGAKHIIRYLKGTKEIGLIYSAQTDAQIEGFSDADHAKDLSTRRSISGYSFFIYGNLVSWRSRMQATVSISSTESEYVALSEAAREDKWLRTLMTEIGLPPLRTTDVLTNNTGAYSLARNPEGHNRLKHIDIHHHLVRELVERQQVNVTQVDTDDNPSDIFTKVTSISRLQSGMQQLGLGNNTTANG